MGPEKVSDPNLAADPQKKDCGCGCGGHKRTDNDEQKDWIVGGIVVIVLILVCWAAWKYKWVKKIETSVGA